VEIVVPYGAGGSTDLTARMLAQRLQDRLGQTFVVINRRARAAASRDVGGARRTDGYTLLMSYATETAVVPQMAKPPKYTIADFEPIAVTGMLPLVARHLQKHRREHARRADRGDPPGARQVHLWRQRRQPVPSLRRLVQPLQHLDVQHIPYKGGAQAMATSPGAISTCSIPGSRRQSRL